MRIPGNLLALKNSHGPFSETSPTIPKLQFSQEKPWITQCTLELIAEMQSHTDFSFQEGKQLRKQVKRSARKNKKQFITTALRDDFHGLSIEKGKVQLFLAGWYRKWSCWLRTRRKVPDLLTIIGQFLSRIPCIRCMLLCSRDDWFITLMRTFATDNLVLDPTALPRNPYTLIMRRIIEAHETQSEPLHALFLDWSKAFDFVTFAAIEKALHFMRVPPTFVQAVMAIYRNPTFRVRESGNISKKCSQTRGLRQGCPLSISFRTRFSASLFRCGIIIPNAVRQNSRHISGKWPTIWDLEHADDTVLLSNSSYHTNRLLHLVTHFGKTRGLKPNEEKCQHLRLSSENRIFMYFLLPVLQSSM